MNIKKIKLRKIFRFLTGLLIGIQAALVIALLAGDKVPATSELASEAFTLGIWMVMTMHFEGKAHNLKEEKENLLKFLNNPSVDPEGGEA